MSSSGRVKVQHYVPQFLLRNFSTAGKVFVFDKLLDRSFNANVKNVAAESRFYDFRVGDEDLTLETALSEVESKARPIIQSIIDASSIAHLAKSDRAELSRFLAIQFTRTKWAREQFRHLPRLLEEALRRKGGEGADLSAIAEHLREPDENELAIQTAGSVLSAARDFAPHFADKLWFLGMTTVENPFLASDNPITLQNMVARGPRGNLGLAVAGIEIYMPLSPTHVLAMYSQSHEAAIRGIAALDGPSGLGAQLLAGIETGAPVKYEPQSVMNANALQVAYAERFLFSSTDDFSHARKLIADHEQLRVGLRSTIQ